ncbi:GMC oxidoreductase [Paenibacillus vietnamensis]|uniref:GMC oxidoreductase n=1 Tax=Paenibacillus vietnamensis TaxID=2590547 RepID=UPI001CD17B2B|nr:GMC oxidoreductase [Paenibacillus vietnamensis]
MENDFTGKDKTPEDIAKRHRNEKDEAERAVLPEPVVEVPGTATAISGSAGAFACPPTDPAPYLDAWVPLTPLAEMAAEEYDVLIIGSGIGGGAALWRLCQRWAGSGKRIGIIEKGGLLLQTHSWNVPTLSEERAARLFVNPAVSAPIGQTLPQFAGAREVYSLGGRTQFWGTVSPRVPGWELEKWPVTRQEIDLYYNIAEDVMGVSDAYVRNSSVTRILLNRLWAHGYTEATGNPMAVDTTPTGFGEVRASPAFSSIDFIAEALNTATFDLAVGAYATKILLDGGRAAGAEVYGPDRKPYTLRAKTVIVAASTLQAARLLLYSGIPGRAIGHYLANHSFVIGNAIMNTTDFPEVNGVLAILVPTTPAAPYQVQIQGPSLYYWYHDRPKPVRREWSLNFFGGFGTVESRYDNRVYLDPSRRDEYGVPQIAVSFSYSPRDLAIIERIKAEMPRIANAAGISLTGKGAQPDLCVLPPGADFHEFGTLRMGDDPNTSATNRYGQVHGVPGLFAAGNSVLPSIGASNPTLSAAAMAIRTADYIVNTSGA